MRITHVSVFVDDLDKALKFYTEKLGFVKKADISHGDFRWLTVVSPEGPDDVELLLEPNTNPAAKTYQEALFAQGIPATMFATDDIQRDYELLKSKGVVFRGEPTQVPGATIVVLEDTCGNLIQLYQP